MRRISWSLALATTVLAGCWRPAVDPIGVLSKVHHGDSYSIVLKSMGSPSRVLYRKDGNACAWIYSISPKEAVVIFDRDTGLVNRKGAIEAGAFTQEKWDKGVAGNWGQ